MKNIKNIFTLSSQIKNLNNTFLIPSPDRRGLGGGIKKLRGCIKNTKAFTLVELIIVITILAVLATIAFISFQGFAKNARDGNRLATLKQLQNGLEVFATKTGYYPDPEGNILTGSINGVVFSNKGIFGDNSSRLIQSSKTPTDPLNSSQYYIYAIDSNKKQYQIATILETLNANNNLENNLIQETYAGNEGNYKSYVVGNYKGYIKYSSGSLTYLANIPSLIWNNTGSVDLLSGSTYFVANKSLNLPYKPNNDTNINISNGNEIVKFITGNQEGVLTGVNITPVISGTSVDSWLSSFGSNSGIILKSFTSLDNLSNGAKNLELAINGSVSVGNNNSNTANYCANQPSYSGATFSIGTPNSPNQSWQNASSSGACYWTCGSGKILSGNECIIQDITPPTGGNFSIPTITNSTNITLTITCPTDANGSMPIYVAYGNSSNPNNWSICTDSISHTLSNGNGSKIVYLRFKDNAGNLTTEISKNTFLNYSGFCNIPLGNTFTYNGLSFTKVKQMSQSIGDLSKLAVGGNQNNNHFYGYNITNGIYRYVGVQYDTMNAQDGLTCPGEKIITGELICQKNTKNIGTWASPNCTSINTQDFINSCNKTNRGAVIGKDPNNYWNTIPDGWVCFSKNNVRVVYNKIGTLAQGNCANSSSTFAVGEIYGSWNGGVDWYKIANNNGLVCGSIPGSTNGLTLGDFNGPGYSYWDYGANSISSRAIGGIHGLRLGQIPLQSNYIDRLTATSSGNQTYLEADLVY